jgi:hypothetical protein
MQLWSVPCEWPGETAFVVGGGPSVLGQEAAHLVGPGGTIVWLGADGQIAANGRTHHHKPHRWAHRPGCYDKQRADLVTIVPSLKALGIAGYNASPGTAWTDLLPGVSLQDALADHRRAA